ncbi:hypothetical protein KOR42_34130 [Thalassoglobus neptunius]|uniref:Uncharacterized protein n=1 Tax=Thalassoglobus neptunius TaxID=1938619 RepID=A0A5C5WLQ8_9PLAN|nr:hypothetical protein KOR42_34130 [Thalassoglobus neptunius]
MERSVRYTGESDTDFRRRAEKAASIARLLVERCFANECVQDYLADEELPLWDEVKLRSEPVVRVEFEQAIAFGGIGECLAATKSKHWGEGPQILPLEQDDWFFAERVTYRYRENSIYNRRFEQRKLMKELLGRKLRKLVGAANYRRHCWEIFRDNNLTPEIENEIADRLGLTAKEFWRASRGKVLYADLPLKERQLRFDFGN